MSKINNWFQIREGCVEEKIYESSSGFGASNGFGDGRGVTRDHPYGDYDNKYGIGSGDGCGFGNKRGEQD